MAGIEKIKQEIISSANKKAGEILGEAEQKASEIANEAKVSSESEVALVLQKADKKVESIKANAESACALDKKNKILDAKISLINEAFLQAENKLCSLNTKEYFEVIKKLIVAYAVKGEGEVVFCEKDKNNIPKGFFEETQKLLGNDKKIKLSNSVDNSIKGGMIIKYEEIEINCEFSAIISSEKEHLIDKVNSCLFG